MTLKRLFIEFTQPFLCLGILMTALVATQATAKPANAKPTTAKAANTKAEGLSSVPSFDFPGHIDLDKQARIIDYPILSGSEGDLSAFDLVIPYDRSAVEILGITSPIPEVGMAYDFLDNEIRFHWTRRVPADIHRGDTLALLKIHLKRKANPHIDRYFSLNMSACKAIRADGGERTDTEWQMAFPTATFSFDLNPTDHPHADMASFSDDAPLTGGTVACGENGPCKTAGNQAMANRKSQEETKESASKRETLLKQQGAEWDQFEILSVIPNPSKTWADITYSISGDCSVYLKLFSPLNQEVMTLVNSGRRTGLYRHNITVSDVAAGIYFLRLETCRDDMQELSDMMKVVVRE